MGKTSCVTIAPVRRLSGELETEHNMLHMGVPRLYTCDRGGTGLVQFGIWDETGLYIWEKRKLVETCP